MKPGKDLIYSPFQEHPFQKPIPQYSVNLPCDIIILEWVWLPYLINNSFEIKVIFHNHDDVGDDHHIRTANPTYDNFKGPFGLITIYCTKYTFKYFTQLESNFICMPLNSYFKSWFSKTICPRITGYYYINNFSYSAKGIGGHWHGQVFYKKKSFFGTSYGMTTPPTLFFTPLYFCINMQMGDTLFMWLPLVPSLKS